MLLLIYLYHSPGCTPPKKPGFLQNLWIVTRLLAKTRLLGPRTTKETGFRLRSTSKFFTESVDCNASSRKNPVAGPRYNQRNRVSTSLNQQVFYRICGL
jgi:hypothetical protein